MGLNCEVNKVQYNWSHSVQIAFSRIFIIKMPFCWFHLEFLKIPSYIMLYYLYM